MLDQGASFEDRAIVTWAKRRLLLAPAAKTLLAASESLTVCAVAALARMRERGEGAKLLADNRRLHIENAELRSENSILRSRLERIPARERPHYTPEVRFRILEHMKRFLLSVEETASRFLITSQTLYNWLAELRRQPDLGSIGTLLRPSPPLTRYADVVRRLVRQMKEAGFHGHREVALTLARFGWKLSPRSVGRFSREGPRRPEPTAPDTRRETVRGRYPNHLWLADITRIPLILPFLHLHLSVVFDAFSRLPLAPPSPTSNPPRLN